MHPLRKLRESGKPTPAEVSYLPRTSCSTARSWCGRSRAGSHRNDFRAVEFYAWFWYLYSRDPSAPLVRNSKTWTKNAFPPMHNRHEVLLQQLRNERKTETGRLDRLKASLRAKLEIKPGDRSDKPQALRVA
jgi:hypothetical protein